MDTSIFYSLHMRNQENTSTLGIQEPLFVWSLPRNHCFTMDFKLQKWVNLSALNPPQPSLQIARTSPGPPGCCSVGSSPAPRRSCGPPVRSLRSARADHVSEGRLWNVVRLQARETPKTGVVGGDSSPTSPWFLRRPESSVNHVSL